MHYNEIFSRLWKDYSAQNPSIGDIYDLFLKKEGQVVNDHIAFRTFNDPRLNIDVLSKAFIAAGYEPKGSYTFEQKKLNAVHFEHTDDKDAPLVFISELRLEDFSASLQENIKEVIDSIDPKRLEADDLLFDGEIFGQPSWKLYNELLEESEYAAWLYINGFRANHFTIRANANTHLDSIEKINEFLKSNGYTINSSGGEIKGAPDQLLEQSSVMAEQIKLQFDEGEKEVSGCYYEFARRYNDENGELFLGFIAKSADKIFESTDSK